MRKLRNTDEDQLRPWPMILLTERYLKDLTIPKSNGIN